MPRLPHENKGKDVKLNASADNVQCACVHHRMTSELVLIIAIGPPKKGVSCMAKKTYLAWCKWSHCDNCLAHSPTELREIKIQGSGVMMSRKNSSQPVRKYLLITLVTVHTPCFVEKLHGTQYQSGSFSLNNVRSGFHCLRSFVFLFHIIFLVLPPANKCSTDTHTSYCFHLPTNATCTKTCSPLF